MRNRGEARLFIQASKLKCAPCGGLEMVPAGDALARAARDCMTPALRAVRRSPEIAILAFCGFFPPRTPVFWMV
jgi:hypothetical protein